MKQPPGRLRRCTTSALAGAGFSAIVAIACGGPAYADLPPKTPAQSVAKNAAPAHTTTIAAPVDAARVVQFLDQTIAWYHQLGAQQQLVSDANDAVYVSADRQMANEVVRLAFQFARTQAEGAQPAAASAQQAPGQRRRPRPRIRR